MTGRFAAIVLSGGRGARLGGTDKGALRLGDRTLLDRALDAVRGAEEVVVVGDRPPDTHGVTYVRERPAYGGPGAALLTGAATLTRDQTAAMVLAVDMPMVTPETVDRVRRAAAGGDGAVLVDESGRRQLALVLDLARLGQIAPDQQDWAGLPFWRLLRRLDLIEVPAVGSEARDIDTAADLAALRGTVD